MQESTEAMAVTKGKIRSVNMHHHGWKATVSIACGLSSIHSRVIQE